MDLKKIIYSLHSLERTILPYVKLGEISKISSKTKLSELEVNKALQLLEAKGYIKLEKIEEIFIGLDKFGQKFLENGLPEENFLEQIIDGPKKLSELTLEKDEISAALGILKRNNIIDIKKEEEMIFSPKENAKQFLFKLSQSNPLKIFAQDILKSQLSDEQRTVYEDLKKRSGFLKEFTKKSFTFKLTEQAEKIAKEIESKYSSLNLIEALDSDMLKTGSWRNKDFRHYDINLKAQYTDIARRHPMIEANNILKDIFVEMGFKEMEGPMVESEFWCFDALWIPQDHPAREEQDTFYLDMKADLPKQYVKEVKNMHEKGINRSHTPQGDWSEETSAKTILRTHSTPTSFRTLAQLGEKLKKGEDIDGKYFYVAYNFRNEAVDATHLMELVQAEGFIIADDLSLADLMGFVKEYYAKLGLHEIRFKPTFNPYTEPSMEAHYYNKDLKKWYALINSGIFRPETLKPFGLENKKVIAWGMGANRVAAILTNKNHVREITGATCDIEWLKTRPIMKRNIGGQ